MLPSIWPSALSRAICLVGRVQRSDRQRTATESCKGRSIRADSGLGPRCKLAMHLAVVNRPGFMVPQEWGKGSFEMFFFYFLSLLSSGKKVKQNLFRIQRQQFLWLTEGRSPTLAVLLLITLLFYFIIFLNCPESCQCYSSACLRPQEGHRLYSSPGYDFVTAV